MPESRFVSTDRVLSAAGSAERTGAEYENSESVVRKFRSNHGPLEVIAGDACGRPPGFGFVSVKEKIVLVQLGPLARGAHRAFILL